MKHYNVYIVSKMFHVQFQIYEDGLIMGFMYINIQFHLSKVRHKYPFLALLLLMSQTRVTLS